MFSNLLCHWFLTLFRCIMQSHSVTCKWGTLPWSLSLGWIIFLHIFSDLFRVTIWQEASHVTCIPLMCRSPHPGSVCRLFFIFSSPFVLCKLLARGNWNHPQIRFKSYWSVQDFSHLPQQCPMFFTVLRQRVEHKRMLHMHRVMVSVVPFLTALKTALFASK